MSRPTLLAVSHGTSDTEGARAISALTDAVTRAIPDVPVRAAYVDVQQPDAAELAPTLDGPVVVVPLLLSGGFHVFHDLHGIARKRPNTVVADPLGPDPRLAEVLDARIAETCDGEDLAPVILAIAGSRDPRSVVDAEGMASLLRERRRAPVELAYLAARQPDLPAALAAHPDAVVATYLLARGFFFDLVVRHATGGTLTLPLLDGGPPPQPLVELVIARYEDAAGRL